MFTVVRSDWGKHTARTAPVKATTVKPGVSARLLCEDRATLIILEVVAAVSNPSRITL